MGILDTKTVLSSLVQTSGETLSLFGAHPESDYTTDTYTFSQDTSKYISGSVYAGDKTKFSATDDYLLYLLLTYGLDPSQLDANPVLGLLPGEDTSPNLPRKATLFEAVLSARLIFDDSSDTYLLWYFIYGWTSSNDSNGNDSQNMDNNNLASRQYDDQYATTFDPTNWWVVPQKDSNFPVYAKGSLLLMLAVGDLQYLDSASDGSGEGTPYLVFSHPVIAQTMDTVGDTSSVTPVILTSLTKNANGYYPGNTITFNPKTASQVTGVKCWVYDFNS